MQEAIRCAKIAYDNNEFPVGAVVVCRGQIISAAHNMVEAHSNPLMHAEILAINDALKGGKCNKYLTDCDIYVTLEPCLMCLKAISLVKIRRIYYGLSNSSEYSIENLNYKQLDFNFVPEIYGGISEVEISELFQKHLFNIRN